MRERLVGAGLFVAAALANLPVVYGLVADTASMPVLTLGFGFLAMGLAWAAGFWLEGRRRWFVVVVAVVGVAEGAFALWRGGAPSAGSQLWMLAAGALSVGALLVVGRPRPVVH